MEEADGLGLCVMQMVADTDSLVDPVASMWNEVHIDRCVVAGDVCGPRHGLQKPDEVSMCNGLHVDRSHRRAIFPTHLSVVALSVVALNVGTDSLGDPVVSMWNEVRVDRSRLHRPLRLPQ
jgi:hypothetical protein